MPFLLSLKKPQNLKLSSLQIIGGEHRYAFLQGTVSLGRIGRFLQSDDLDPDNVNYSNTAGENSLFRVRTGLKIT